jgi:hypothetical protein
MQKQLFKNLNEKQHIYQVLDVVTNTESTYPYCTICYKRVYIISNRKK